MNINDKDQYRIIRDPDNQNNNKVPVMPLIVSLDSGIIGEACTLRGAIALIIGEEYFDAEDSLDEYAYRLEAARKESMRAIAKGINAEVYDSKAGIIPGNYAAKSGDPDYDPENVPPIYINIETEKLFLLSLLKIDALSIYEREGSNLLKTADNNSDISEEYAGGTYIDIVREYNIDDLIAENIKSI